MSSWSEDEIAREHGDALTVHDRVPAPALDELIQRVVVTDHRRMVADELIERPRKTL